MKVDPLEIFALDADGKYDWIESAQGFVEASKLMCKYAASNSGTFFVYSHRTGVKTYYKVANNTEVICLPARPPSNAVAGRM